MMLNKFFAGVAFAATALIAFTPAHAGFETRRSGIDFKARPHNYGKFPEISAPTGHPSANHGWLYVKDNAGTSGLYFEDDSGNVTNLTSTSAYDDVGDPDANATIAFTTYTGTWSGTSTAADQWTFTNSGTFGDISVVKIAQSGNATDGTVLEVVSVDTDVDALVVTANSINSIAVAGSGDCTITGGTGVLDYTDFDVSADGVITTSPDGSPAACMTIAPSAAATTGLVVSSANLTNAIDVGDKTILGTTGALDYTNFDVDGSGNVTIGGTLDVTGATTLSGTFYLNSVVPSSGNLTLDANGAGTVTIGGTSTGAVIIAGGTTAVEIGDSSTDTLCIDSRITSNVRLDDDSGDSPSILFKDSDDEVGTIYQNQTSDDLEVVCASAADAFAVTTGNLSVGTPASDVITINGGDFYVSDDVEIDGTLVVDSTGSGLDVNEDVDVDFDGEGEEMNVASSATNYAADEAMVTFQNSGAGQDDNHYLLRLRHNADADANDKFLVLEDNNGATDLVDFSGGGVTTWTLDAGAYVKIDADTTANTTTAGVLDIDFQSATPTGKAVSITCQMEEGATSLYGLSIDLDDDSSGGEEHWIGLDITNLTGTEGDTAGIQLGLTLDRGIVMQTRPTGTALHLQAHDHTSTTGVIDASYSSITNGAHYYNLSLDVDDTAAGNEIISGFYLDLDDDTVTNASFIDGIHVNATDLDGNATTLVRAFMVTSADVALQADKGYVRIGTGSTPDVTPGDDDLFVEGTAEVDGVMYADGGINTGDATDSILKTVIVAVTSAEVKALNAAPKQLIATPGAGRWIELVSVRLALVYGGNDVFTETDDNLVVQYGTSGIDVTGTIETTGWIDQAVDQQALIHATDIVTTPVTNTVNNKLELYNPNDEIAGNATADNVLHVIVTYWDHDDGV